MLLCVLHHFLALSDEVWSGLWQWSPQVISRYGLLPSLVICLKFVEGNAFGVPTTLSSHKQHSEPQFLPKTIKLGSFPLALRSYALYWSGSLITCDVTDEGFPIIIFGKRVKPRMDPMLVPHFEGWYLENEKKFFKNNFETVFWGPNSVIRNQLLKTLQLTFKLWRQMYSNKSCNFH